MRVLVVDDDAPVRRLFRACLEADGTTVDEAPDSYQALALATQNDYDALVTDFLLPGCRADIMLDRLLVRHDRPPVIVVTGLASPRLEEDLIRRGATAVLEKPLTCDELTEAVAAVRLEALSAPSAT